MGAVPLALTQGDPAGIGPELTLKAWLLRDAERLPPFLAVADPEVLLATAARLGLPVPIVACEPAAASDVFATALPVLPVPAGAASVEPGRPDPATASGTTASIETAVALTRTGATAAVVTNPIAKHVLYLSGFPHPGHTEFLATLAVGPGETPPRPVMMLWSEALAVVPVTIHVPLASVPTALTADAIVETGMIVAQDLAARFGVVRPRIAVAGLNPHAGERGTIGTEDRDVVEPAIRRLQAAGLDATGPWPADTMFHGAARRRYDAALCMYHDQALIPIKTLAFDKGVNVTLGLPFVRTSPDHGTAFDIAGLGVARPTSLIAAIRLASRMASSGGRAAA